jgi:hypothetical protein
MPRRKNFLRKVKGKWGADRNFHVIESRDKVHCHTKDLVRAYIFSGTAAFFPLFISLHSFASKKLSSVGNFCDYMVYATLALVSYQISGESMVSILLLATLLAHRAQRIRVHAPELVKLCVRPWQSRRASHATTRKRNNSRSIRSPYSHIKRPCHREKTKFLLARLFYDWWQKLQHTIFYGPFLSLSLRMCLMRENQRVCAGALLS